jgi:hypothetical protein
MNATADQIAGALELYAACLRSADPGAVLLEARTNSTGI